MPTASSTRTEDTYPKPNRPKDFKGPVRWLLGPQLIASLKRTALYVAYKGKLDPRDWMRASLIRLDQLERFNSSEQASPDEYWFDYLADAGDGQLPMYSIAYLCLGDLWVDPNVHAGSEIELSEKPAAAMRLPRGEFLFIGGDTAYHVADYQTLAVRFQAPLTWAYQDLTEDKKVSRDQARRFLFGIPGNHDYYDIIDGFGRQFAEPTSNEGEKNREGLAPQLSIPGFERRQSASYVALKLPFDWWLWGLDNETDRLDIRQQEFFKGLGSTRPDRLIVATPEPSTVLGVRAKPDGKVAKAFADLNLEQPFLECQTLPAGTCRLDLSGDTHHYARYWGPSSDGSDSRPAANNYASVVSGLGGAFLHPSDTDMGQIREQVRYPSPRVSRTEVARRLFSPANIIGGGYVAILAAFGAAVTFFGATVPESTRVVVEKIFAFLHLSLPNLLNLPELFPSITWPLQNLAQASGLSRFGIALRALSLIASIVLIAASVFQAKALVDLSRKEEEKSRRYTVRFALLIILGVVCLVFGIWRLIEYRENLSPFQCSLMILFSLLLSATGLVGSSVYSELLFKRAYTQTVQWWHYWPVVLLVILAAASPVLGFQFFGRYPAQYLGADLLFAVVVLGAPSLLVLLATIVGGELQGIAGKAGFFALGLWHALLQIMVPLLLARRGDWRSWIVALGAVLVLWIAGNLLVSKLKARRTLAVVWLIYGAILLGLPVVLHGQSAPWLDMWIVRFICAVLMGALMGCVSLGWYFVVSLAFNGHNDQAGGAARIAEFKEFIRVRLTRDSLTAYVVGVDQPEMRGSQLRPKVIDVFELRP
jgi:hypothetical protein